jgi:hypothetical protein
MLIIVKLSKYNYADCHYIHCHGT